MENSKYILSYKQTTDKALEIVKLLEGFEYCKVDEILGQVKQFLSVNRKKDLPDVINIDYDYLKSRVEKHISNVNSVI